jgi:protein-tyrosine phosphatase
VTHVLNVSESENVICPEPDGLRAVVWLPVVDLELIPDEIALECIEQLHAFLCEPDARAYVHCIAGGNRSPTILWLYLIACGIEPEEARRAIGRRAISAVPGHPRMIDPRLVLVARGHGRSWLPHPRPAALDWAPEFG